MDTATILLILSGMAIALMLAVKVLELRFKKRLLVKILPHDHHVVGTLRAAGNIISAIKQKQTNVMQGAMSKSKEKIFALVHSIREQVGKKSVEFGEWIRGRRMLRQNGSVSFFLRHVAEYKHHKTPNTTSMHSSKNLMRDTKTGFIE